MEKNIVLCNEIKKRLEAEPAAISHNKASFRAISVLL